MKKTNKHNESINSLTVTAKQDIKQYSPADLSRILSSGRWKPAPHLLYINELLMNLSGRKFYNLIVNMPPRHGKSEFISKYFVAWHLLRFPEKRIILTSYSNNFAELWGRRVRELMEEFGKDLFGIGIKPKTRSYKSFDLDGFDGGLHCAGAGSSLTGRGADLLIIDDPVKNNSDARSAFKRDNLYEWLLSTALSRLEPSAITILIMTRWHTADLTGKILDNMKVVPASLPSSSGQIQLTDEHWLHLSLPALAGEGDALLRQPGEPLWPERYDSDKLNRIRLQTGSFWFNSLYQQNPLSDEESLFKKKYFRYFFDDGDYFKLGNRTAPDRIILKSDCLVRATIDLAVTNKETSDFTVAIVFAVTSDYKVLVLDVYREKLSGSEQIHLIDNIVAKWHPQIIGIESVQYQAAFIDQLRSRGLNIKALSPKGHDKQMRAIGIQTRLTAGTVFFRANAEWLPDFEKELMEFPNGRYDDQVDAFAYIDFLLFGNSGALPVGVKLTGKITSNYK